MVNRFGCLLLLVCSLRLDAAPRPITFVVLGDRTGGARPNVFAQIVDEIKLLGPDLVLSVGDLIEGYTEDRATLNREWDSVLGLVRSVGVPFYACPGNHDIFDAASESVFVRRVGPRRRALRLGSASFIFFDNSRWPTSESLPRAELRWLESELARACRSRQTLVLMHRPWWRTALESGMPDQLHELFRRYGVDYVFTGHDHFYCTHTQDSIRYFQVGPSGSRTKAHPDPARGGFQNYLWCRISGDTVTVEVREPGRYAALPADVVTWDAVQALNRAMREVVTIERLSVPGTGRLSTEARVTLLNTTDTHVSGQFVWQDSGTAWRIVPGRISFALTPRGSASQSFRFSLPGPDSIFPLPRYNMPFEYLPGRRTELNECLPIRREAGLIRVRNRPLLDGRLDDPCWQTTASLRSFGAQDGARGAIEPAQVWVGADESLLFLAIRCQESDTARIKAKVKERDGRVYDDDHVNIVLSFGSITDYYQLFVNSEGTLADRRCVVQGDRSRKDYAWDGNWRVASYRGGDFWSLELSCPLADFGSVGKDWTVNAVRFQSRFDAIGVWQVPFEHDPATFGLLRH